MKQIRIFCLLVTSVFVGGSGVAFGLDAACGTLGDEDLILTLPCVVSGDKAYSATLLPIKRPDGNVGKWTLQAGSVKSASFNPGNNNCANFNAGVDLAVRCVLHDGALWSAEFGANYPVFDLRSYEPYTTNELFGDSQVTYKIGDTGPYGGKVFYISPDGSSGLEAALADAGDVRWGNYAWTTGATGIAIGTGQSNTDAIIALPIAYSAAKLARDYIWPNGQKGGYLPSKDELNELYKHKHVVGGFANDYYWSSSEFYSYDAWFQYFANGNQYGTSKYDPYLVRAVRAF
jgi:hypothetical protein